MELTKEEIQKQDYVDMCCFGLLQMLAKPGNIKWDIEQIGIIRDAAQEVICDNLLLMTAQEFYPALIEAENG